MNQILDVEFMIVGLRRNLK